MYHFFVQQDQIGETTVRIAGTDVNHIKNVLRMGPGEEILLSNGVDKDYLCEILSISSDEVTAKILEIREGGTELPVEIYLFQGLPKSDKMELIIQKAVELGVFKIIPVETKRAVVKLIRRKRSQKSNAGRLFLKVRPSSPNGFDSGSNRCKRLFGKPLNLQRNLTFFCFLLNMRRNGAHKGDCFPHKAGYESWNFHRAGRRL